MLCVKDLFWYIAYNWNYRILATPARTIVKTRLNCLAQHPNKPLNQNDISKWHLRLSQHSSKMFLLFDRGALWVSRGFNCTKCLEMSGTWKWVRKSRKNEEFRENGRTKAIEPLPLTSSVAMLVWGITHDNNLTRKDSVHLFWLKFFYVGHKSQTN